MAKLSMTLRLGVLAATLLGATVLITVGAPATNAVELPGVKTTLIDFDRVAVEWATESPTISAVVYGPTNDYGLLWFDATPKLNHRVDLAGLGCDSIYHLDIITIGAGNLVENSGDIEVRTGPCPPDNTTIAPVQVVAKAHSAVITWGSLAAGQGTVRYGPSNQYQDAAFEDSTSARFHRVELTGLDCDTGYFFEGATEGEAGAVETTGPLNFGTYACDPFVDNVAVDSGVTTATITWTTDSPATGSVIIGESTDYGQELNTGTQADIHRADIANLKCGTTYHYRLIAADQFGEAFWTPDATLRTAACTTADVWGDAESSRTPKIDSVATETGETSILVSWSTDEVASAAVTYSPSSDGDDVVDPPIDPASITVLGDYSGVIHEVLVTGLSCDSPYTITLRSTDGSGFTSISAPFTTNTQTCGSAIEVELTQRSPNQTPGETPVELAMSDVNIRDITTTTVAVTWSTTASATGSVAFGESAELSSETQSAVAGLTQRIVLSGLSCGTTYSYNPTAHAQNNVVVVSGGVGNFTTLPCAPTSIGEVSVAAGRFSVALSWTTDVRSDSLVAFGADPGYGSVSYNPALVTDHTMVLTGLDCEVTYNLRVVAGTNAAVPTFGPNVEVTTLGCSNEPDAPPPVEPPPVAEPPVPEPPLIEPPDIDLPPIDEPPVGPPTGGQPGDDLPNTDGPVVDPPVALTDIEVDTTDSTARVSWLTDQATSSVVEYGTTVNYGFIQADSTLRVQHLADLADLDCATTYHFKVTASPAGSGAVRSGDLMFTTNACPGEPFAITDQQVQTTMSGATISWATTQDAAGRVDFGRNGDLATAIENSDLLPEQSFVLAGLDCGSQYSYRIEASRPDAFANSGVLTFETEACAAV